MGLILSGKELNLFLRQHPHMDQIVQISLRENTPVDERVNGHSHIRSMFFNSSETIPVEKGKLILGQWKRIFGIELDPIRSREIVCSFISS